MQKAGGIVQTDVYPYVSGLTSAPQDTCRAIELNQIVAKLSTYQSVCTSINPSENALRDAIANVGPIDVGIYVSSNFQNYQSGVFSDPSYTGQEINHAVLGVGYGTDPTTNQDYFTIMNVK